MRSVDADSGPLGIYFDAVCSSNCHQPFTFTPIGSEHTVFIYEEIKKILNFRCHSTQHLKYLFMNKCKIGFNNNTFQKINPKITTIQTNFIPHIRTT